MIRASSTDLPPLSAAWSWLTTASNWTSSPNNLLVHLREHVFYTLLAVLIALIIALPLGLFVGHTGRGVVVVAGLANILRAIPALGLVVLLIVGVSDKIHWIHPVPGLLAKGAFPYFVPIEIILILLAIPPILVNTYAGVQNVDPAARDAAKGMGMTGGQVVRRVEFPCALPLIFSGLRSSVLQVIATATVAAYAPLLGGLGRLIVDGAGQINSPTQGYPAMVGAGIVVAALALVVDILLVIVQHFTVSRGISGRFKKNKHTAAALPADGTVAEVELMRV